MLADTDTSRNWRGLLAATDAFLKVKRFEQAVKVCERAVELMESIEVITDEAKDNARYRLGHARAELACVGFAESLKDLPPKEQDELVLKKFNEIHGGSNVFTIDHPRQCKTANLACLYLQPLRGLSYDWLSVTRGSIRDLEPLRGTGFRYLSLQPVMVSDINPLRGMPLQYLRIWDAPVSEFSPLIGMPLRILDCQSIPVSDISPLTGLPLEALHLVACNRITGLQPLSGLKLETLDLDRNNHVTDLSAVQEMPLKSLSFSLLTRMCG